MHFPKFSKMRKQQTATDDATAHRKCMSRMQNESVIMEIENDV